MNFLLLFIQFLSFLLCNEINVLTKLDGQRTDGSTHFFNQGWRPLRDTGVQEVPRVITLILPKMLCTSCLYHTKLSFSRCPDWLILHPRHEGLRSNPSDSANLTDNFPLHPCCSRLSPCLFLLEASPTYVTPPDRLSDSKSETLIQRSAQVSWILLKSHFHLTSPLLASPHPPAPKTPAININLLPLPLPGPSTHCSSENGRSSSFLSAGHCPPPPYSQVIVLPAAQTSRPHRSAKTKNSFNLFDVSWRRGDWTHHTGFPSEPPVSSSFSFSHTFFYFLFVL